MTSKDRSKFDWNILFSLFSLLIAVISIFFAYGVHRGSSKEALKNLSRKVVEQEIIGSRNADSISEIQKNFKGIETNFSNNENKIKSLRDEVKNNSGRLSDIERSLQGIETNLSNNENKIKSLRDEVKNNSGRLSDIERSLHGRIDGIYKQMIKNLEEQRDLFKSFRNEKNQ